MTSFMYENSRAFGSPCLLPETASGPRSIVKACCLAAGLLLRQPRTRPVVSHAQNLPARDSVSTEQAQPHTETILHAPFRTIIA